MINLPPKITTFHKKVTIYLQLVNISLEIISILQNMLIFALYIDVRVCLCVNVFVFCLCVSLFVSVCVLLAEQLRAKRHAPGSCV